jgi:hypothetical protein
MGEKRRGKKRIFPLLAENRPLKITLPITDHTQRQEA